MPLKAALIIPDCHVPYHDQKAAGLMLRAVRDAHRSRSRIPGIEPTPEISEVVLLGDFADFYAVSSHSKHAEKQHTLLQEIPKVNEALDTLDRWLPRAKKVYIEGNHENRLTRYLQNNAPALFGTTSTEYLLNLNRRPLWSFIEYGPNQLYQILNSKLYARHEPLSMSSAGASLKKAMNNLVYGHIHKIEEAQMVTVLGEEFVNFSVGWLGSQIHAHAFGYTKSRPNWQQGFGLVYVDTETGDFYHQKIKIHPNYTCVINGVMYK